jgi:hypothetical protein
VLQQNTSEEYGHVSDAERILTGTWVIDEVRLAVRKGYKFIEIFEKHEYTVTQYDPKTGHGEMFVEYNNTFLKLNAEASGHPDWVRTAVNENKFVQAFWESEGIRLNKEGIKINAAQLGLANLCLNSMCGKLSVRPNRPQMKLISVPQEIYGLLAPADIEVCSMQLASDKIVWIAWRYAEEPTPHKLCHWQLRYGRRAYTPVRLISPAE